MRGRRPRRLPGAAQFPPTLPSNSQGRWRPCPLQGVTARRGQPAGAGVDFCTCVRAGSDFFGQDPQEERMFASGARTCIYKKKQEFHETVFTLSTGEAR